MKNNMAKIFIALSYAILFSFTTSLFASPAIPKSTCLYYFYGAGCKHCANVKPILNKMQSKYPNLKIVSFETFKNINNFNRLNQYFNAYRVGANGKGVPAMFISNQYLIGDDYIIKNLENAIINHPDAPCPQL